MLNTSWILNPYSYKKEIAWDWMIVNYHLPEMWVAPKITWKAYLTYEKIHEDRVLKKYGRIVEIIKVFMQNSTIKA
jgi:hypothetical protein